MEAKGKVNMMLRLIMMMIVRAEVFMTVVDVHKSVVSWWSWWGNGARFAVPVCCFRRVKYFVKFLRLELSTKGCVLMGVCIGALAIAF